MGLPPYFERLSATTFGLKQLDSVEKLVYAARHPHPLTPTSSISV